MAYSLEMGGASPRRQTQPRLPAHTPNGAGAPSIVGPGQSGALQPQILVRKSVDNAIRWNEGERLDHLFEQRCDQFTGTGKDQAVVTDDVALSFRELDNLANQVARYLLDQGITSGDRVGLLFDRTIDSYVALLAVLKVNAAYVPLDAGFPTERVRFILSDAGVKSVVSLSAFRGKLDEFAVRQILLDTAEREISAKPKTRLSDAEKAPPVDQLAYLIYTSGTTGNPKGVVIEHPSICNFVRVAAELYGFRPGDRVYQGMTIAFDFSVEELWVPLIAGATLVPGKPGASLVGDDLADFLRQRKVTGLCCVPTLLATIEKDLPDLRILLVSGEACPHNLMVRWHRPGRTILNAYGPTEATVTATLTELHPEKPVTIGGPLPTYSIVILDPHKDEALAPGEMGEIGIAGIGLAAGYLNRDDLTQKKFIPDFLQIPNNPSGRIYRTGDLGRITETDEVEFHGRIDTQVKIRGYRIELTEIESVLLELPQIAQAAVITHESEPGMVELAAYYSLKQGVMELPHAEVSEALRNRLPAYMVPAYLEQLPIIPMTVSNKADHKKLPAPKGPRFSVGAAKFVAPRGETETILAGALAEVLKLERVSAEDNFFKDLGAHSLLMARFCAKIRQHASLSDVSMRDIYLNPTIAKLAAHLGKAVAVVDESPVPAKQLPFRIPSNLEYYGCGALQALFYMATGALGLWVISRAAIWTYAAVDNPGELYLRSLALTVGFFVAMTAIPIAAKWLLIGQWKEEAIPIWSLRYFRFWVVKTLVQSAPMAALAGTPIYNLYLRLLGAKIGRDTVIQGRLIPVCTDLLSIGDNTIIRKDAIVLGYKARSNYIHTGSVTIGNNAVVGEASVLDIDTAMGNDTQLGHASSLQSGQRVPDGKHYHGSPAQETTADYCPVEAKPCSSLRRWLYPGIPLTAGLAIFAPAAIMILNYWYPFVVRYMGGTELDYGVMGAVLLPLALVVSLVLLVGALVTGLVGVAVVPRLFNKLLQPEKTYVLYGFHYWVHGIVAGASNSRIYNLLFGDSSAIVHYLTLIGWNLNKVEQTGSNFGTNQKHDNPFLCEIGSSTMVSDGLSMMNAQMSSSSFKLSQVKIGDRNYLGNNIFFPPAAKTGTDCLLGTKVMIPIDGPVREGVGLLGSPCFEIPRAVERDRNFTKSLDDEARRARLKKKNAHNLVTVVLYLLGNWAFACVSLFAIHAAVLLYPRHGLASLFVAGAFLSLTAILYYALLERASLGFRPLRPQVASVYDPYFWFHERHWKFCESPLMTHVQGHALQERDLPPAGREGRPQGVRRRRSVSREDADRDRRLCEPQRGFHPAGPFARGRRVQVRLHQDRQRLHDRVQRLRALRRHHGRPCGARRQLLPDEGRDRRGACPLAR